MKYSIVAMNKDKWIVGELNGSKVSVIREIKSIEDVPDSKYYVTLKNYKNKSDKKLLDVLKNNELEKVYIKTSVPSSCEKPKEFNAYWWSEKNEKCLKCRKKCKQSSYAEILVCKDYEPKRGYK